MLDGLKFVPLRSCTGWGANAKEKGAVAESGGTPQQSLPQPQATVQSQGQSSVQKVPQPSGTPVAAPTPSQQQQRGTTPQGGTTAGGTTQQGGSNNNNGGVRSWSSVTGGSKSRGMSQMLTQPMPRFVPAECHMMISERTQLQLHEDALTITHRTDGKKGNNCLCR